MEEEEEEKRGEKKRGRRIRGKRKGTQEGGVRLEASLIPKKAASFWTWANEKRDQGEEFKYKKKLKKGYG